MPQEQLRLTCTRVPAAHIQVNLVGVWPGTLSEHAALHSTYMWRAKAVTRERGTEQVSSTCTEAATHHRQMCAFCQQLQLQRLLLLLLLEPLRTLSALTSASAAAVVGALLVASVEAVLAAAA